MSAEFLKHSIQPSNSRSQYSEFQTLDFVVSAEGRRILANTFRLSGKVRVLPDSTTPSVPVDPATQNILWDPVCGAHSLIESIQTSITGAGGVVENVTGYNRYVGMVGDATTSANDTMNSENICELKGAFQEMMTKILRGEQDEENLREFNDPNSFSIKPLFCLNATSSADGSGDLSMSYSKTGAIRVQVTLARNFATLFGLDVGTNSAYVLTDCRLEFMSVPESGKSNKTAHRVKYHIRQAINSGSVNVSVKVPAVCNSVSCSFIKQNDENTATANALARQTLPNVTQLNYLFNNNLSERIQFTIRERTEQLMRYLESFKNIEHNRMTLKNLACNKSYGLGLNFGDFVDLSNQTFSLQVTSNVSSGDPYSAHMYFHSLVEL